MAKGKILHISKYYPPYAGGLEDLCKSLVDGTSEYEQKVLCFNDKHYDVTDIVGGVEVIRVGLWEEVARQPISFHYIRVLRKVLKQYNPDIIHFHVPNPLVSLYVQLFVPRSTKIIVHWHSDIIVHKFIHFFFSPIEKRLLKRADHILATSPNYIDGSPLLSRHRDKITVIPSMVSEPKFHKKVRPGFTVGSIHAKYGNDIVLFVGRHVKYKGIDRLISAAKLLEPGSNVLIAGTGPETNNLKMMAAGMTNVHFIGRLPDSELAIYMKAAKVFAFPSITKNEAFGLVLAEAMYNGLVPVTFTIKGSGVNWVSLANVTGLEVPNSDVKAFAEAIDSLLDDDALREKYSKAAQERVRQNFLFKHVHDELLEVYGNILSKD